MLVCLKRLMWVLILQMHGAFMICMGMFQSGQVTQFEIGGYADNYIYSLSSAVISADQNTKFNSIESYPTSAVGFGFRVAIKPKNSAPIDLNSTAPLAIAENLPVGTIVGEFNATDPNGDTILTIS